MKTKKHKTRTASKTKGTRRHLSSSSLQLFQREMTIVFLEMLLMVKLFHWKTTSYATHKATDELYAKLNANVDSFIEILLGKAGGERTDLTKTRHIRLMDLSSLENVKREVVSFKSFLVDLDNHAAMKQMSNTDLYNIRDTILGDLNQFLYLLSFQ